jgi:hypothetical protein
MRVHLKTIGAALAFAALAGAARGAVTSAEITSRQDVAAPDVDYQRIVGRLHFAVDPHDPHNAVIANLDKAARDGSGRVPFTADLYVLAPKHPRPDAPVLISILNRGRKLTLSGFDHAALSNDPVKAADLGDEFLLKRGITIVWVGWQFNVPERNGLMGLSAPMANGAAIGGVGFAAVRDAAAWIRNSPDAVVHGRYLYAFGLSQSGRFLRDFLYEGFNEDEHGRQVFDGVMAHIAGASRINLNTPGADPSSLGMFTATSFPFADRALKDPVSGVVDGELDNPRARAHQPKIFYTNTDVEYWGGGRVAALIHETPGGTADLTPPANVRVYFLAGTQHGPAAFPPKATAGQQRNNPTDYWWIMRALFVAMDAWVRDGVAPPPSRHPRLADGTLVPAASVKFPAIPGVASPRALTAGKRVANPLQPGGAGAGAALPLLVPQVDADGNDISGIRLPDVAVPLATLTGWNFRSGSDAALAPLLGSFVPFAPTRAVRQKTHDPRPSIEARYASRTAYLAKVRQVAETLVRERYLLGADVPGVVREAAAHWDALAASKQH